MHLCTTPSCGQRDKTIYCQCLVIVDLKSRVSYSLIAFTKSLKDPYVKRGSGSSLKNILRAPVVTWMSSHLLSSRSTFSSDGGGWREAVMEKRDHNYRTINIMCVCVCLCRVCVLCAESSLHGPTNVQLYHPI